MTRSRLQTGHFGALNLCRRLRTSTYRPRIEWVSKNRSFSTPHSVWDVLGEACAERLEELGTTASGSGRGLPAELKADPGQVSLETLLREVDKLAGVRALQLPPGL